MKIAKYIGDLLYDYECVVIPGLGGFLTNDKSATVNTSSNQFNPPNKQILFNAFLKTNDGLLVNYVAREESLNYKDAKSQVDQFVLLCHKALDLGKRIHFHNVGYIYKGKEDKLIFEQDKNINYNPEAFGLSSFVSPAIKRTTAEDKLKEKIIGKTEKLASDRKKINKTTNINAKSRKESQESKTKHYSAKESHRKSPYRTQIAFIGVLIILIAIGWGFMNKEKVKKYYNNYSSVIPFFYPNTNDYILKNINHIPISKIVKPNKKSLTSIGKTDVLISKKKNVKPPLPQVKKYENNIVGISQKDNSKTIRKATTSLKIKENKNKFSKLNQHKIKSYGLKVNNLSNVQKKYFIIAGSFKDYKNAQNLIQKLRYAGYPARKAGVNKYGMIRVAYAGFKNKNIAEQQLLTIRKSKNPSAWIFVN